MRNYTRSQEYLHRAEQVIPQGSQTFSKSRMVYPYGAAPHFATHGQGCRLWDVDGNEYIDFVSGLAAINLGYNDADVTSAVVEQLTSGVTFSLSHPIEIKTAELLTELVPCAEMVRFGKNGSDATAAAVRLARAYTNRDHVAVCGYHGWQDWYIGTTSLSRGVPKATRDLTHTFAYNDIESLRTLLKERPTQIAAVILEPVNKTEPAPGYLESVKETAHEFGALLIFDEMITGFRVAKGGAQEHYGVVPDLATFGKALANGYPVSAIAGNAKIMRLMEETFFSLTYGGEALSLSAAFATMDKLKREPVIETLVRLGTRLKAGVETLIARYSAGHLVSITGHPTGTFVIFRSTDAYSEGQLLALFMQEMMDRGILTIGKHNINYAHGDGEIDRLLQAYDEVLPLLKRVVEHQSMDKHFRGVEQETKFRLR